MSYFVTGATGFIGRHLVKNLLADGATVYALVREGSEGRLSAARRTWGSRAENVVPVRGDLTRSGLGLADGEVRSLRGRVQHFFHLAAL